MQQYISLTHAGVRYDSWTLDALLAEGVPQSAIDAAVAPVERLAQVRGAIRANGGDTLSMLGTTADASAIALHGLASLAANLSTAQDIAEVRAAAEPFAAFAASFLSKVESGDVVLPFMVKDTESVFGDIEARASVVSDALVANQPVD